MRRRIVLSAVLATASLIAGGGVLAVPAAASGTRAVGDLKIGSIIQLQNQYGAGSYLDTYGYGTAPGSKYAVSTTDDPGRIAIGTSRWQVVSATGRPPGSDVLSGDSIYLVNQYAGDGASGGYLDVNGFSNVPTAWYSVSTTATKNRDGDSGKWRITAADSSPQDGLIRNGNTVHLQSEYGGNGGFLDTNGLNPTGNKYGVSTNPYWNRSNASTATWKVLVP